MFFSGTPNSLKFTVFSILPDPGCPGDPMVRGPYSLCCVLGHCRRHPSSWCPAGTPADGFWGRTRWYRGGYGSFARQIWLENGENFTSWILPDPGCPGDPKIGSYSDCMVSWVSGIWDGFGMMGMMGMMA